MTAVWTMRTTIQKNFFSLGKQIIYKTDAGLFVLMSGNLPYLFWFSFKSLMMYVTTEYESYMDNREA